MQKKILRGVSLYFDGVSYFGKINEFTLPEISLKTEEIQSGLAPVKIPMGLESLDFTLSLDSYEKDVIAAIGLGAGKVIQVTARGSFFNTSSGANMAAEILMTGMVTKFSRDAWKPAEMARPSIEMNLRYYEERLDDDTIQKIDIDNHIWENNGVDQLEEERAALGI